MHVAAMGFWVSSLAWVWALPVSWRIPFLVVVSIYANVVGHWSGWSAERPTEIVEP